MKTASNTEPRDLRAIADAAIAAWRASQATTLAAGRAHGAAIKSGSGASDLDRILTDIKFNEARHAEAIAQQKASVALDAAERAEGDTLAIAIDPIRLAAELPEAIAAEAKAHAVFIAAQAASFERVRNSYAAIESLAARRGEQNLPGPMRLPSAESAAALVSALSQPSEPPAAVAGFAARLHQLRIDENKERASLERKRLAQEQEEERNIAIRKNREFADELQRVEERAKHQASEAAEREAAAETERLAEAHRQRVAG